LTRQWVGMLLKWPIEPPARTVCANSCATHMVEHGADLRSGNCCWPRDISTRRLHPPGARHLKEVHRQFHPRSTRQRVRCGLRRARGLLWFRRQTGGKSVFQTSEERHEHPCCARRHRHNVRCSRLSARMANEPARRRTLCGLTSASCADFLLIRSVIWERSGPERIEHSTSRLSGHAL